MSQALTGSPQRGVTLTEQANSQRIGRSMFIGHSAGYVLVLIGIVVALSLTGFAQPGRYQAVFAVTDPPFVIDQPVTVLVPWAMLALALLAALIWTDLGVRRRHDRGRSGVDVVVFQILFLASVVIHGFAYAPDIVGWLDGLLVLYGLYLFFVLVLLPSSAHENRYGPVPRPS